MNKLNLIAIILMLTINALATTPVVKGVTIITVGSVGSGCDITTGTTKIQDGIDSNFSAVHIVNSETYNENIIIDDRNITIVGGFTNCADAANGIRLPNAKSIIDGSTNTQSTIRIFGSTLFHNVNLTGLEITGGESNALGGGGILALAADVQIVLRNSFIHNNFGRFGGGIGILASSTRTNLFAFDTLVLDNEADDGGGLYCIYSGSGIPPIIEFDENSAISENAAISGNGGGVFTNDCSFRISAGDNAFQFVLGINRNTASLQGGGIYAINESKIILYGQEDCGVLGCRGNNEHPVSISENVAQGNGGGMYISDFLTTLEINSAIIFNNSSGSNGGGIAVEAGASVTISRPHKECWDESRCNLLQDNKSGETQGLGGFIYNNDATANITQAFIAFNRADFGTVLYGIGNNSNTTFVGSVVSSNGPTPFGQLVHGGRNVFRVAGGAQVDVYHSTIADNFADIAVFGIVSTAGAVSEIHNSIIHDIGSNDTLIEPFAGSASLVDFKNCILHEKTSLGLPLFPTRADLMVADPLFVGRSLNNYHIDPINSPAIDFAVNDHSFLPDIDFETRGIDNPAINNFFGPYDIGADESQRPDEMFKDGFEN